MRYSLRRLDMLKVDNEIYKHLESAAPHMLPYEACNISVHITKLYVGFRRTQLLNDQLYWELKKAFNYYYKSFQKYRAAVFKCKSKRQIVAVTLFSLSPEMMYNLLIRIERKEYQS